MLSSAEVISCSDCDVTRLLNFGILLYCSKKLLVKLHLLVKLELRSKKDLAEKRVLSIMTLVFDSHVHEETLHFPLKNRIITVHAQYK